MQLSDALKDSTLRESLIDGCVGALEAEVAGKKGMSGMAIRSGYAAFKRVQPGIARDAFGRLLPLFAPAIQPHWDQACTSDPAAYFDAHGGEVADAMLSVTDRLAAKASNRVLAGIYRSLRGMARPHVVSAVSRVPGVLSVVTHGGPVV